MRKNQIILDEAARSVRRAFVGSLAGSATMLGVIGAVMGLTASSAIAATDAQPLGAAAPSGGTVIFGADQEPRTLNTFTVEGNAAWGSYVLAPVVTWGSKYNNRGVLVHDLLQSVTVNDQSPLIVTYRIKPAAKWSDGRQVTSADMIFTYQQIMNPNNSISSRVGFEDIGSIRKVNSKTIRVTFKKVFAAYESLWGRFLPAHSGGGILGQDFNQAWRNGPPIANGPFRFVSWSRGSQMVVQKNPAYWGKQATLNQIVFRFIPDTNTQFQAMRGGEVNIIHPQPQPQAHATGAAFLFAVDAGDVRALDPELGRLRLRALARARPDGHEGDARDPETGRSGASPRHCVIHGGREAVPGWFGCGQARPAVWRVREDDAREAGLSGPADLSRRAARAAV